MSERNKRILKIVGVVLAGITITGLSFLYSLAEPDTVPSYFVFRVVYSFPVETSSILRVYSGGFKEYNGGYIGEPIDKFLSSRLETINSENERSAIIDFYIAQAGGREGQHIASISDGAKQKVIESIMRRLDSYDIWQTENALLIVEWLRRGKILCKGNIGLRRDPETTSNYDWKKWWVEEGALKTKELYRTWWNSNLSWQEKKQLNPLNNSTIRVGEGCG